MLEVPVYFQFYSRTVCLSVVHTESRINRNIKKRLKSNMIIHLEDIPGDCAYRETFTLNWMIILGYMKVLKKRWNEIFYMIMGEKTGRGEI